MARGQIEDGATGAAVAETTMTTMTMMMIMAVCDTGRRGRWHDAVPVAMLDNSIVTVVIVTPSLMMFLYGTERMYIVTSGNFIEEYRPVYLTRRSLMSRMMIHRVKPDESSRIGSHCISREDRRFLDDIGTSKTFCLTAVF
ncbi:unnamed protein product [Onchocerca ochengi]|uniref:Secreted protein n=1 Tax=Onchocerca ochengi TaxID=42157 RepID=A0A182ER32_ONCOC|nr:unnamed protein product [Onchocerca ochengi]